MRPSDVDHSQFLIPDAPPEPLELLCSPGALMPYSSSDGPTSSHHDFSNSHCSSYSLMSESWSDTMSDFLNSLTSQFTQDSLILINARSVLPKFHLIQAICGLVAPFFLCITETWLNPSTPDSSLHIPGYKLHRKDRFNRYGGGCLIYSRNDLGATNFEFPFQCPVEEAIWISTTCTAIPILLGCMYCPPSPSTSFKRSLVDLFSTALGVSPGAKVICGDFNLPEISWEQHVPIHLQGAIRAQTEAIGWVQQVMRPTRGEHILDLVFTEGFPSATAGVGPLLPGSDHRMVHFAFPSKLSPIRACNFDNSTSLNLDLQTSVTDSCKEQRHAFRIAPTVHSLSEGILSAFSTIIRTLDWTDFFMPRSAASGFDFFYQAFLSWLHVLDPPKSGPLTHVSSGPAIIKVAKKNRKVAYDIQKFS